jgi:hypothetical protein
LQQGIRNCYSEIPQSLQKYISETEKIRAGYGDIELPRRNYVAITEAHEGTGTNTPLCFLTRELQRSSERIRDRRATATKLRGISTGVERIWKGLTTYIAIHNCYKIITLRVTGLKKDAKRPEGGHKGVIFNGI